MTPNQVNKNWQLRVEAMMHFVNHPDLSIKDVGLDPRFSGVSEQTLYNWAKKDKWREKREAQQKHWLEKAKERLGSEILQQQRRELEEINNLRVLTNDKLTDPAVIPKSWEGVAKVRLAMSDRLDKLRTSIANEVTTQKADPFAGMELDEEERAEVIKFVLELKRKRVEALRQPDAYTRELPQIEAGEDEEEAEAEEDEAEDGAFWGPYVEGEE